LPRILDLQAAPAMEFRVASIPASFGESVSRASGFPVTPLRRFRLPTRLRVAPNPRSSGLTGDGASSCLASRILWRLREQSFRFPRCSVRSAPPPDVASGFPGCRIFRLAYGESSGCPESSPSGLALGTVSRFPRLLRPLACLGITSSSFPESMILWPRR